MTINKETFEAVRTALANKVRVYHSPDWPSDPPDRIGTNSYEPDPNYDGLRAVFQEERFGQITGLPAVSLGIVSRFSYWRDADDGSFEGALVKSFLQMWALYNTKIDHVMASLTSLLLNRRGDTRQAACEAVLKWLKEETP